MNTSWTVWLVEDERCVPIFFYERDLLEESYTILCKNGLLEKVWINDITRTIAVSMYKIRGWCWCHGHHWALLRKCTSRHEGIFNELVVWDSLSAKCDIRRYIRHFESTTHLRILVILKKNSFHRPARVLSSPFSFTVYITLWNRFKLQP